eukprot:gene26461-biopygen16548
MSRGGCRDRNRAGIEAADTPFFFLLFNNADPARDRHVRKTNGKEHLKLDCGREQAPRDMSPSETGHCYSGI